LFYYADKSGAGVLPLQRLIAMPLQKFIFGGVIVKEKIIEFLLANANPSIILRIKKEL